MALARIALAPHPEAPGLAAFLASTLDFPVEPTQLSSLVAFDASARLDPAGEWRMFHLIGAALRHSSKAL